MDFRLTIPVLLMLTGAAISMMLIIFSWQKRQKMSLIFFLLMVSTFIWSFTAACEAADMNLAHKVLWAKISYLGVVTVPVFWFLFSAQYTQRPFWFSLRRQCFLWAVPVVTFGLTLTNERHKLIWTDIRPLTTSTGIWLIYEHGPSFWFFAAYGYVLTFVGALWLFHLAFRSHKYFRKQVGVMIACALIPWTGNLLYLFKLTPWPGFDLTPFFFSLTGLVIAWGIIQMRIFDLSPIGREILLEKMGDGILVLNAENFILDINRAASKMVGYQNNQLIGSSIDRVFQHHPDFVKLCNTEQDIDIEFEFNPDTWLEIRISPLFDRRKKKNGRLIILQDITQRKEIESELAAQRDFFLQVMTATANGITVTNEQGVFEYVNPAYAHMLDQEPENLIGKSPFAVTLAQDHQVLGEQYAMRRKGASSNYESILVSSTGKQTPVLITSVPRVENKRNVGTIAAITDLTERKQIEEAIAFRSALEEELIHFSTQFVDMPIEEMDHAFNNALERIGSFCQMERAYIFQFNFLEQTMSMTHEWYVADLSSEFATLQNVQYGIMPLWMDKIGRAHV